MNSIPHISQHFTPIQPSLFNPEGKVTYREVSPASRLANGIYCYWELKTQEVLEASFTYRVVTDGCIDLIWEMHDPGTSYIMGFSTAYTEFPLGDNFHYFGIRFLPTAFPLLFQVDASELTNRFESLDSVLPSLSHSLSPLTEFSLNLETLKTQLDPFFLSHFSSTSFSPDPRLYQALDQILTHHGTLSLSKDLDVGLSPRQLRRVFQYYIGDNPKTFCKVVRFQSLLRAKPSRESLRKNKLFFDLGYYDQAHFIKEFKHLYGESPASAFGSSKD